MKLVKEIFECPFFDECNLIEPQYYFDNNIEQRMLAPECKAPFLQYNGKPLCKLVLEASRVNEYPNNIKGVRLYKSIFATIERALKK